MRLSPSQMIPGLAAALLLVQGNSQAADATADPNPSSMEAPDPGTAPNRSPTIIGEWSPEPELCADSRLTFTAEGRHEALMADAGSWLVLASGRYDQDGRRLRIDFEGEVQQREIVSVDRQRLVLRHDDEALAEVTGGYDVVLHRCQHRGAPAPG